ncbi:MAG TPA: cupin domain-containing protein [Patescibacteria group bacterium]|jgi:quercetin dioxygenase-like cupin family protein|nr:cupin domain-containing protein [Patescibacteria group bacterium]
MANDAVTIAPKIHTVIFENSKVRALKVVVEPGDTAEMHSHPDNIIMVTQGGTLTMTDKNGTKEVTLTTGDTFFSDRNEHSVENKSGNTVKVIQIELKS